ncbi:MAG: EamA family transporter [candidate division KSB1 bacterium]|nr:EamA family transporter [candidate division KSB1 bacterium]MDZ7303609.1 EamA family transporter [candidate division KSB1 bacterium]MDZ7312846.1 EamA family transporter [candidate division KSB1 bacterium]
MTTPSPKTPKLAILAALLIIYLVWGSTYLAIRIGLEGWPPALMAGTRFVIAGALLLVVGRLRHEPWPQSWAQIRTVTIAGILMITIGNFSVVWAELFVPSGMTAVIVATVSLWMIILEGLRPNGEPVTLAKLFGVIIGLTGVAVLMMPELNGGQSRNALVGQFGLLLGSLSWAAGSIYTRHAPIPKSTTIGSALQMLAGGLVLLFISEIRGEFAEFEFALIVGKPLFAIAYLIVFGSAIAFTAYIFLLHRAGPALASTYAFVNPVVAVILGTIILDEPVTPWLLAGTVLVILSLAVIQQAKLRKLARLVEKSHVPEGGTQPPSARVLIQNLDAKFIATKTEPHPYRK